MITLCILSAMPALAVSFKEANIRGNVNVGVYLGTFDPFTLGHKEVAEFALKQGLDYVLVLPRDIAFHKPGSTPVVIKLEMLKAEIGNHPRLVYPGSEFKIPNIAWYTRRLQRRGVNLVGIVGEDIIRSKQNPKLNTTEMLGNVKEYLAFRRSSEPMPEVKEFAGKPLRVVDIPMSDRKYLTASSSKVRKFLAKHAKRFFSDFSWQPSFQDLPISEAMRSKIREFGLYHPKMSWWHTKCLQANLRIQRLFSSSR